MKTLSLLVTLIVSCVTLATAQIPVTVSRTTVTNGIGVSFPSFSSLEPNGTGGSASTTWQIPGVGMIGNGYLSSVTGSANASPSSGTGAPFTTQITCYPVVVIPTNAPSVFTNSISAYWGISVNGGTANTVYGTHNQSYAVNIMENAGGAGGGVTMASVTITGQPDSLESVSRKSTANPVRKLLGFTLASNTNVTMSALAFVLSNSTTNSPAAMNLTNLILFRDADGGGTYDGNDTQLATTTNAHGFAIFSGLSQSITPTNTFTYFLAAPFMPTNQTRNSFISASLSAANISVALWGTNALLATGSVLGKQYAFLDSSQAEDDEAAAALALQISNATRGLGTSTAKDGKTPSLSDSVLPAAAAGAAGGAAAFSSDSLGKAPLSSEFTPPK